MIDELRELIHGDFESTMIKPRETGNSSFVAILMVKSNIHWMYQK